MEAKQNGADRENRITPFGLNEPSPTPWFRFQEYWVDFLGGLLPGTLFSVGAIVALLPATVLLINNISLNFEKTFTDIIITVLEKTQGTPNTIWLALASAFLGVSYVLGHMFYRQDPKRPNVESFEVLKTELLGKKGNELSDDEINLLKNELGCTSKDDCEFPFPYFDNYLKNRGLKYLDTFIVWGGENDKNRKYRTKNFINILKMRLKFYFPNRCSTIIRNEAHVRLSSSTWYVGWGLDLCAKVAIIGIFISVILCTVVYIFGPALFLVLPDERVMSELMARHFTAAIAAIIVFYAARYVRTRVEKFLHYQRQREVVHVLETAWTAFQHQSYLLDPPFDKYPPDVLNYDRPYRKDETEEFSEDQHEVDRLKSLLAKNEELLIVLKKAAKHFAKESG